MEIGEKIKSLRTAKLMTQKELAGQQITRNMLSCIENGTAQPSLGTVRYLAERLKVSPGYLLADEADEAIYRHREQMDNIKRSFLNGDFRICRDMCLKMGDTPDDETQLILSETCLNIGIEEFNRGNLRKACVLLDECLEHSAQTIYYTDNLIAVAGFYFRYMRLISATLGSELLDESEISVYPGLHDVFGRYTLLLEETEQKNNCILARELKEKGSLPHPFDLHLQARDYMAEGDYTAAHETLHRLLVGDSTISKPVLYFIFCDFELCCKECKDYKGAYESAANKMDLLQHLLT